jgi:hypothetical protein
MGIDDLRAGLLVGPKYFAHILRVELSRKLRRTHQVAEHDGQLPTFGGRLSHRLKRASGRLDGRRRVIELRYRAKDPSSMAKRGDPHLPEVIV